MHANNMRHCPPPKSQHSLHPVTHSQSPGTGCGCTRHRSPPSHVRRHQSWGPPSAATQPAPCKEQVGGRGEVARQECSRRTRHQSQECALTNSQKATAVTFTAAPGSPPHTHACCRWQAALCPALLSCLKPSPCQQQDSPLPLSRTHPPDVFEVNVKQVLQSRALNFDHNPLAALQRGQVDLQQGTPASQAASHQQTVPARQQQGHKLGQCPARH